MKELLRLMKYHTREYETRRLRLQRLRANAHGGAVSDGSSSSSSSSSDSDSESSGGESSGSKSDSGKGSEDEGGPGSESNSSPDRTASRDLMALARGRKSSGSAAAGGDGARSPKSRRSRKGKRRGGLAAQDSKSKLQLMAAAAGLPSVSLDEEDAFPRDILAVAIAPDTRTEASRLQWRRLFEESLKADTLEQMGADRLMAKALGKKHKARRGAKAVGAGTSSKGWFGGVFGRGDDQEDPWLGYWLSNPLRMLGKK